MASDPSKPHRPLSEISHLFLTDVRNRQTDGSPRPQRQPPPRADVSIDMTAEEFAQAFGMSRNEDVGTQPESVNGDSMAIKSPNVTAIIGSHLNGEQLERARELARYLAHHDQRIGLIELDASELRLTSYEVRGEIEEEPPAEALECADSHQAAEALAEMNWDVDQWLLVMPTPRIAEARQLLRVVDRWVLLCTGDHDGVVASYRALKGLADLHRPHLSLALLDSSGGAQAQRTFDKLSGVCRQFLDWTLEEEIAVEPVPDVSEHLVMRFAAQRDGAAQDEASAWQIVGAFLAKSKPLMASADSEIPSEARAGEEKAMPIRTQVAKEPVADVVVPVEQAGDSGRWAVGGGHSEQTNIEHRTPNTEHRTEGPKPEARNPKSVEIFDLTGPGASVGEILDAVIRQASGQWIQCPLHPPTCPEARLTVMRDGTLLLLAAAGEGLGDLRGIGEAYRWLSENRPLICMALPQLTIDAHALPRLHLLVDQADLSAESLHPMLAQGHVTVQSYRKVRWGPKTGLLLEAA